MHILLLLPSKKDVSPSYSERQNQKASPSSVVRGHHVSKSVDDLYAVAVVSSRLRSLWNDTTAVVASGLA